MKWATRHAIKYRGMAYLSLIALVLSIVWLGSSWTSSGHQYADPEISAISSDLNVIEDRQLHVIAAFMDRDGSIIVREFGDLRNDRVAPENTLVDLGSITKTVTAVAILKLVEQDWLDLDETLDSIWRDVPDDRASITVHELLTHTSGLPDNVGHDKERLSREAFVDRVFDTDFDEDDIGEYRYSNVGYGLLAAIVERRSGKTFDAFLEQDILQPAGLQGPLGYERAYRNDRSLLSGRAWATWFREQPIHDTSWGGRTPGWNLIGNGGLVATPVSFLRFWSAVRQGRVISNELLSEALTPQVNGREEGGSAYGYGLMIQDMPLYGRVYLHDGENEFFSSEWREFAESGLHLFTAGRGDDAFEAMRLILERLREQADS